MFESVLSKLPYFSSFYEKDLSLDEKLDVAENIHGFYCGGSDELTLADYYNKFAKGSEDTSDQAIYNLITKEIAFYSEAARDPEVKEMCDRHVEVLATLQSVAYKKSRTYFTDPDQLIHAILFGGLFGGLMGILPLALVLNSSIIQNDWKNNKLTFKNHTELIPFYLCSFFGFFMCKSVLQGTFESYQRMKRNADWALEQRDVVQVTHLPDGYLVKDFKEFVRPGTYYSGLFFFAPVTNYGVQFSKSSNQAIELSSKYLEKHRFSKIEAA